MSLPAALAAAWARWAARRARAGVRANLARARPSAGGEELDALFERMVEGFAEYHAWGWRAAAGEDLAALVDAEEVLGPAADLRKRGRGVVLVCPTAGNIHALLTLPRFGLPLTAMFAYADPSTAAPGPGRARLVSLGLGAAACLKALAANEAVLLPGDVDYFPGGRRAAFFGAPFHPPHGASRLAAAAGAPLLPVTVESRGGRFRLRAAAAVESGDQEAAETALLRALESFIAERPEQWFLLYDAFDLESSDERSRRVLRRLRFRHAVDRLLRR